MDQNAQAQTHVPHKSLLFESRREREFYRYYEPIRMLTEHGPPVYGAGDGQPYQPTSSPDRALTAFCQLGALRLGSRRTLLNFFDSTSAYILAEATRTLSLQDDKVHELEDELWLGHCILPRGFSICEATVCRSPAELGDSGEDSDSICIINDLEADVRFCDSPFVTEGPKVRFYAGVPITTPKGITIGAYCCLDDKTRPGGLDAKEIAFLKDMAATVMAHLEMVRAKREFERGTRMVRGLAAFIEGAPNTPDWNGNELNDDKDGREPSVNEHDNHERPPQITLRDTSRSHGGVKETIVPQPKEPSSAAADFRRNSESARSLHEFTPDGANATPSEPELASVARSFTPDSGRQDDEWRDALVASNVRTTFSRATQLLRDAMGVDGAVFLDAAISHYGGLVPEDDSESGSDESSGEHVSGDETRSRSNRSTAGKLSPAIPGDRACNVIASSHAAQDMFHSRAQVQASVSTLHVTEQFLQSLLKRFPRGKIWNFGKEGTTSSDDDSESFAASRRLWDDRSTSRRTISGSEADSNASGTKRRRRKADRIDDGKQIQLLFPGVRSLALIGVWDQTRGRWFAGCAVWTYSAFRSFSAEPEMSFMSAYCDVIMAEVQRLEALNSDTAKSDFISSISHELRSPLHGILGSVECLIEQTLDPFSASLATQIEICGRTQLEIVENLLDFSKLGHQVRSQNPRRRGNTRDVQQPLTGMLSVDIDIPLDSITEEVVESSVYSFCCGRDKQIILNRDVAVILDIDRPSSDGWRCSLPLGGWKRICINLISNALKYTQKGFIHVSLKSSIIPGKKKRFNAILSITDSGLGMTKDFVENHLFRAFSQENSLAEGTGLGMSLVAKILKALGGRIEVTSEKGQGTTMTVICPMDHSRRPKDATDNNSKIQASRRYSMRGLVVGICGFGDIDEQRIVSGEPSTTAGRRLLLASLRQKCVELEMVSERIQDPFEDTHDVLMITESDWRRVEGGSTHNHTAESLRNKSIVVVCDTDISARQLRTSVSSAFRNLHLVAQPCGSQRLYQALSACLETSEQSNDATLREQPKAGSVFPPIGDGRSTTAPIPLTGPGSLHELLTAAAPMEPIAILPERPERVQRDDSDLSQTRLQFTESNGARPRLARLASKPPPTMNQKADEASPPPKKKSLSLLLVDDNHINLQLLVSYAKKEGHRRLTAMDGEAAVDAYKTACLIDQAEIDASSDSGRQAALLTTRPQVILMDINMPKMNGFQATREIRKYEQQYGLKPAHVICLTGLGSALAQQEAYSSGVDLFLTKPVRLKELTSLLNSIQDETANA